VVRDMYERDNLHSRRRHDREPTSHNTVQHRARHAPQHCALQRTHRRHAPHPSSKPAPRHRRRNGRPHAAVKRLHRWRRRARRPYSKRAVYPEDARGDA
ncbi:hypothetical protein M422DRAFT_33177, partial [Sphaerobolus stellatus SS14]